MQIKFWGTRGSLPAPLTAEDVLDKVGGAIYSSRQEDFVSWSRVEVDAWVKENLPFELWGTYGGDTTCCEVRCGDIIIVIDMGSGLRRFGQSIMGEMFANKGINIHFLMSHIHWDHIQGFPFFGPIFIPKGMAENRFEFYGGTDWQRSLEEALAGQMDPPVFPVELQKIQDEGPQMAFRPVWDRFSVKFIEGDDEVVCSCRRLNHPNETYGWRIEHNGIVFVFASDTEPFRGSHQALIDMAREANVLYLDCQFSSAQYFGKDGPSRQGWGHGYDEWCAEVAKEAKVGRLVIGHHDPGSSDEAIVDIEECVGSHFSDTTAAYDGLTIKL